jgi:hypothetical protein
MTLFPVSCDRAKPVLNTKIINDTGGIRFASTDPAYITDD